ncbi:ATP-binding protein [uncultured Amnibacterium sp.]|uniref:ATP-binding protein n=1 Tax=uncultured Amnibacterium sp. TaxID=1631851 RepID=UPI0035CBD448
MSDASTTHLLARVGVVEDRVRRLIASRRASDPQPDDPFRGLYITDAMADRLLAGERGTSPASAVQPMLQDCERRADEAEAAGERLRLRDLTRRFHLGALDVELLLIALAADLDPRFEPLFGYLNDDVTRRRPSIGLALELAGASLASASARGRLLHGPLVTGLLLTVDDADRPLPSRALTVPDRVVAHLLGDNAPDPAATPALTEEPAIAWGSTTAVVRAVRAGARLLYLRESSLSSSVGLAATALGQAGFGALTVDLAAMSTGTREEARRTARIVAREALLSGRGLVAHPVPAPDPAVLQELCLQALCAGDLPTVFVGHGPWDPDWVRDPVLVVDGVDAGAADRTTLWQQELGGSAGDLPVGAATAQFRLDPGQIRMAARSAVRQAAASEQGVVTEAHLAAGARAQNGAAMDRLARRVQPAVGWDDLVLPATALSALHELEIRARYRERVLGDWRMRPGGGRGHGVVALFAGDSGTGKTMAAEVVARQLELDLYVIDLASVVDKYIGETEKNLDRIFTAADRTNAVLLFDEADSVFGKRSDVKDAHDRYANIESAYLLQRIESFDGLAILATNLRANIDDAFLRRLDVLIDFPMPDAAHRSRLWDISLARGVPRGDDLDLTFLGASFELSGGAIRSAAVTSAYLAAAGDEPVAMRHLIGGVQREYRKLGRLTLEGEFGRYWDLIAPERPSSGLAAQG